MLVVLTMADEIIIFIFFFVLFYIFHIFLYKHVTVKLKKWFKLFIKSDSKHCFFLKEKTEIEILSLTTNFLVINLGKLPQVEASKNKKFDHSIYASLKV